MLWALEIVAEVVFKGLMGRADLNGLDGTVVSYQPSTKRFKLRVASIDSLCSAGHSLTLGGHQLAA